MRLHGNSARFRRTQELLRPADKGGAGADITIPVVGVPASVGANILRSRRIDLLWDVDELPAVGQVACQAEPENDMITTGHGLFNLAAEMSSSQVGFFLFLCDFQ